MGKQVVLGDPGRKAVLPVYFNVNKVLKALSCCHVVGQQDLKLPLTPPLAFGGKLGGKL